MNGGAFAYLILTKLKNQIKFMLKKPSRLIYVIIVIILLGFTIFSGNQAVIENDSIFRDIRELKAIILALYIFMFIMTVNMGFNRGGSMFTMTDINLMFTSPISSQKILFYGLLQQITTSLLVGFFIIFQYSMLHMNYGISIGGLFVILLGYGITVFLSQVTAMVLYSFTSSSEKKRNVFKAVFYGIIVCFVLYASYNIFNGDGTILSKAISVADGMVMKCFPIAGWLTGLTMGLLSMSLNDIIFGLVLTLIYFALIVSAIYFGDPDYYEDVIKSAEMSHSAITAQKEGHMTEAAPQNIKVGKTGFSKGWGADVFFYKHMLENRRSRILFLSKTSIIFVICVIGMSFFMKETGISAIFVMATYMQFISVMLGRFNVELSKPFIYMIPEPPFKKMLWSLAEAVPSSFIEAVVMFVPVGFIINSNPIDILLCIAARMSFALIFTAANIVVGRIWGGNVSKVLVMLLYLVVVLVFIAPGIVLAVVLSTVETLVLSENVVILTSFIICNIPFSLVAMYLSRNMLQYVELNHQ